MKENNLGLIFISIVAIIGIMSMFFYTTHLDNSNLITGNAAKLSKQTRECKSILVAYDTANSIDGSGLYRKANMCVYDDGTVKTTYVGTEILTTEEYYEEKMLT
jgi:uncharacterized membrane protein YukC